MRRTAPHRVAERLAALLAGAGWSIAAAQPRPIAVETPAPGPVHQAPAHRVPARQAPALWRDPSAAPDARAAAAVRAMTLDEKIALVHTHVGTPYKGLPKPPGAIGSAAVWPGVPRLGIPPSQEADGSLGVANPLHAPALYGTTALPSTLALAASFDPALARAGGAMIGGQARAKGFGVLLAGGANLVRDPRGGRNFEFAGEDPLLAGRMVGAMIAGVGDAGVVSTLKHFALNDQESGRTVLSADLSEAAARESDLLAFELALEDGHPGAVMTSYNRINGTYTSEDASLLAILKRDWRFPGYVMSDWGATHSTRDAALAGLDQQSGEEFDRLGYFSDLLKRAVQRGEVPQARLDDMVRRVLRSSFAAGILDRPPAADGAVDLAAGGEVAQRIARAGAVLLKNDGVLPLRPDLRRLVVIGAHANIGVLSGGGSSQVIPDGAQPFSAEQPKGAVLGVKYYHPSVPVEALAQAAPGAAVTFVDGRDHAAAAEAARGADAVVLFAEQWQAESRDAPDLALPSEQDALVAAVAAANPRLVVVLETGGAVTMPWLDHVPAVLEAWYPGAGGAPALADLLFGRANPSGRLPVTFPQSESQLPRPTVPGAGDDANPGGPATAGFPVDYAIEGAAVGYRWFAERRLRPLFPFGYGLSYTRFGYSGLAVETKGGTVTASVTVRNEGGREGTDTPQFYVGSAARGAGFAQRLVGWGRVPLRPGEERRVAVAVDRRLLARFDARRHRWKLIGGRYDISVQRDAATPGPRQAFELKAATFKP